ncbi:MAG: hypothetical protein JNM69_43385 [Archangium sp.]|nr:hypothetical protein [Archangium sp.]
MLELDGDGRAAHRLIDTSLGSRSRSEAFELGSGPPVPRWTLGCLTGRCETASLAHLWLLPHNEVLYQRTMPARSLFLSAKQLPDDVGGRMFVHSAKLFEQTLVDRGGAALLEGLRRHGLLIELGLVDDGHPERQFLPAMRLGFTLLCYAAAHELRARQAPQRLAH